MVILCIDNDPEDIDLFCDAVKVVDPSITFLSALGGQEALALLSSVEDIKQLPEYVFLDINMPRMDGKDTLKEIRKIERHRSMQIIMLSTGLSPRDHEVYKQLGADHFMSKATSFQDLCDKLKAILKPQQL
jgi:CheY-like chemotaxis protein